MSLRIETLKNSIRKYLFTIRCTVEHRLLLEECVVSRSHEFIWPIASQPALCRANFVKKNVRHKIPVEAFPFDSPSQYNISSYRNRNLLNEGSPKLIMIIIQMIFPLARNYSVYMKVHIVLKRCVCYDHDIELELIRSKLNEYSLRNVFVMNAMDQLSMVLIFHIQYKYITYSKRAIYYLHFWSNTFESDII